MAGLQWMRGRAMRAVFVVALLSIAAVPIGLDLAGAFDADSAGDDRATPTVPAGTFATSTPAPTVTPTRGETLTAYASALIPASVGPVQVEGEPLQGLYVGRGPDEPADGFGAHVRVFVTECTPRYAAGYVGAGTAYAPFGTKGYLFDLVTDSTGRQEVDVVTPGRTRVEADGRGAGVLSTADALRTLAAEVAAFADADPANPCATTS